MESPLTIRPIEARDRAGWEVMWAGYLAFYKTTLTPEISESAFARILSRDLIGLIAEDTNSRPVGFVHALLHQGTWSPKPLCYLEDLFVREEARGTGVGRALIEALAARGRAEGWLRLYWQTSLSNETAQKLYDNVAHRTDWLRYDLDL